MSKELDALNEQIKKDIELDRRKKAVAEKELDLKEKRVDIAFSELVKNKEDTDKSKSVGFGKLSERAIKQLRDDNASYLEAAKHPIPFICSEFDNLVPFFRKNLILLMSASGGGKSTAVCNIVYSAMKNRNPLNGKGYRILILTNEEAPEDMINRLTCFVKGWQYSNHNEFNDEQRETFDKYIEIFARKGNVNVIGDVFEGIDGWTTTAEGVVQVFDNLIKAEDHYDVVILDYFQNVVRSREKPELDEFKVQRLLATEFDRIKNIYPGVIVVMAQCDPLRDEEDTTPYNLRIKGSKIIITKSTFICEITPKYELLYSKWKVHKSRFTKAMGREIWTGYDRGRFVPYSTDFQKSVAGMINKALEEKAQRDAGVSPEPEKEESNG